MTKQARLQMRRVTSLLTRLQEKRSLETYDVGMDRKPGHLTKSVQEIAGSLFWIKVKLPNYVGAKTKQAGL